jgi:hypothetical protein
MSSYPIGLDPQSLGLTNDLRKLGSGAVASEVAPDALFSANHVNSAVIEYDAGNLPDVLSITRKVLSNLGV